MYENERDNTNFKIKMLFTLIILGFLFITLLLGVRVVDAGEVGVVTRFGEVTERTLDPGAHVVIPFVNGVKTYNTKKVIYETTVEEKQKGSDADYKDYPVDTNTSDGQSVDIFYTVRFSVNAAQANWVAQNIGSQDALVETIVKTESRIWARNVPRRYSAEVLYTGKGSEEVQNDIFAELEPTFKANGLVLDAVGIREIKFNQQYITAIEEKQIEAVKVQTAENIAARAEFEKEARITQAEGQAEEQRLQRETLTDQLLTKQFLERWDGHLPTYMGDGGSGGLFFNIPLQ